MLASACLSNDSLLAHASAEQSLSQRVVDLVCPCVIEVFSLQVNLWPSILAAGQATKSGSHCTFALCIIDFCMLQQKHCSDIGLTSCNAQRAYQHGTGVILCPHSPLVWQQTLTADQSTWGQ